MCRQDYKSLCAVATIGAILVNTQPDIQTDSIWPVYMKSSASWAGNCLLTSNLTTVTSRHILVNETVELVHKVKRWPTFKNVMSAFHCRYRVCRRALLNSGPLSVCRIRGGPKYARTRCSSPMATSWALLLLSGNKMWNFVKWSSTWQM